MIDFSAPILKKGGSKIDQRAACTCFYYGTEARRNGVGIVSAKANFAAYGAGGVLKATNMSLITEQCGDVPSFSASFERLRGRIPTALLRISRRRHVLTSIPEVEEGNEQCESHQREANWPALCEIFALLDEYDFLMTGKVSHTLALTTTRRQPRCSSTKLPLERVRSVVRFFGMRIPWRWVRCLWSVRTDGTHPNWDVLDCGRFTDSEW